MAANMSDNYEKVVLVLALLIALGLGGLVYSKSGQVEEDFPALGGGGGKAEAPPNQKAVTQANEAVDAPQEWKQGVTKDKRPVDLITGRKLFMKQGDTDPVDLGDPDYQMVHEGIENGWWIENRIDPGWANAPDLDPDGDGFSNREEYDAKTDPNDFTSHGALITKLRLSKLDKTPFYLTYSSHTAFGAVKPEDTFQFRVETINPLNPRQKLRNSSDLIPAGDPQASVFFTKKGAAQLRFALDSVEHERRENPRTKAMEDVYTATLTDLSPNKKGKKYKVEKGTKTGRFIRDYKATLFLDAIGQKGVDIVVEENESFALPHDEAAADKPYRFKEVRNQGQAGQEEAVIEYTENGESKELVLKIGAE